MLSLVSLLIALELASIHELHRKTAQEHRQYLRCASCLQERDPVSVAE